MAVTAEAAEAADTTKPTTQGDLADGVDPQLISIEEAAVILGKSSRTVARLIAEGKLTTRHVLGRKLIVRAEVVDLRDKASK